MAGPRALITPSVLRWARESSGHGVDEAARSAQVEPERLESWERGEARPTLRQLRLLANKYKRPIAVFYLPEPPKDFQALRDFRRVPGEVPEESPALRLAIRQARHRRTIALELLTALGEEIPELVLEADLGESSEAVGGRFRSALGVDFSLQSTWRTEYEAWNGWRSRLEALDVLVFQYPGVPVSEARGFSLQDENDLRFPVVAVNSRDAPRGRVFTMLHELTHLALRQAGLCDLREDPAAPPETREVEIFCNAVAGATLVPAGELSAHPTVADHDGGERWSDDELAALSRDFGGASRETTLRRLLTLGWTSQEFYREKRAQYLAEYERRARESSTGGPAPVTRTLSRVGQAFARLVLEAYDREIVTASRLSDHFELKLKHLPELRESADRTSDSLF